MFMDWATEKEFPLGFTTLRITYAMRLAWQTAAMETHPDGLRWATMGVIGNGAWSGNDYFHGYGPVSRDIPASEARLFFRLHGPT